MQIYHGRSTMVDAGLRTTDNPPSTIPAEILDTSARPDIVIVSAGEITFIELTVPYNSPDSLLNARSRKEGKEIALSDLETKGMISELVCIEIGALGHWCIRTLVH